MKISKTFGTTAAALMVSAQAFAHHDSDSAMTATSSTFSSILHWLTVPPHNVIALASAAVIAFTVYKFAKSKRA